MELNNIFKSYDINRTCPPKRIMVTHVNDINTRIIELELTQGDEKLVFDSGCTAFASFVDRRTKQLIKDSEECFFNESGNILIPVDNLHFHGKKDVNIEVSIKNQSQQQVLALPFPLWIRVNPSILDDAEITEDSLGTVPELLEEVWEALNDGSKEEKVNKKSSIPVLAQDGDAEINYPTVGAVKDYVLPRTQTEVLYDDTAYNDPNAPANNEHYMFFFGEQNSPGSSAVNLGLPQLTAADYGKVYHFEIAFEQANMRNNGVIIQEYDSQGVVINFRQYKPVVQGDIIRFDYTMSADNIIKFRMRMYENAGAQRIKVKITKDIQVTEYTHPKSLIDERINAKADLSLFDTEPVYTEKQGMTVSGWALTNLGVPSTGPGSSLILIADVEGGEKLKISGRPASAKYFYCSFFSENIEFDSTKANGGFTYNYSAGGLRNADAAAVNNYSDVLVTAPDNAKKVIVCGTTSFVPSVYTESGERLNRKWSGKKWCAVGDSLTEKNATAAKNYTDYIAEATGIEVINMGLSGSGYKKKESSSQSFYQRIGNLPADSEALDCDVVTVFGSFNDANYVSDAINIPWNSSTQMVINADGEIVSGGGSANYIVSRAIPVTSGKYYRVRTKMSGPNAFFVFTDADNNPVYVEKVTDTDGNYPANYNKVLTYNGYIKAPWNAEKLYISSCEGTSSTYTYLAESIIGTVDSKFVEGADNSLCACINKTIDNIYAKMPTVNIGIISSVPWENFNPYTKPGADLYVDLLESICKKRGIPFLNLYNESNLRPWDAAFRNSMYKYDDAHPDEDGHKLFAPRIEAFLDELLLH